MHLERIDGPDSTYLQALVRFPLVATESAWWRSYARRMAAIPGLDQIASAFRIRIGRDGSVDRLFSTVFDHRSEPAARRFFGGFSFLEGIDPDSVELPGTAADFEGWAADFPPLRCPVVPQPLHVAGHAWLASNFRVATCLDALLREAHSFGHGFAYQAQFRPYSPSGDDLRAVGRNLIALQAEKGVPREVVADQEKEARRFAGATLLIEEIAAAADAESAAWLSSALSRFFRSPAGRARLDAPDFHFGDAGGEEARLMMHSSLLYEDWTAPDLLCSQAEEEAFRTRLVATRPAVEGAARRKPTAAPEPPPTPFPADLPLPPTFDGPGQVFISYRRSDIARIAPILQRLSTAGFPIWYDRGIQGGDEWDTVLERKIEEAGLILFFLSPAAVESKYCRREVKFADAIDKPLLVVAIERAELRHGLRFLLAPLQQISVADRDFESQLERAIARLIGRAPVA